MNQKELLVYIVDRFRKIQAFVRLLPFIYAMIYAIVLLSYLFTSETIRIFLDMFLYVSPLVVGTNIVLSYYCDLCKWHRTECILILFTPMLSLLNFFCPLPISDVDTTFIIALSTLIISIPLAYLVFIK